uniref:Uncharacterized protein n=1 Tax=Brassica oleracea var. oleracea TaxID=109376 RepID=A0A0D3BMV2_BRAOL
MIKEEEAQQEEDDAQLNEAGESEEEDDPPLNESGGRTRLLSSYVQDFHHIYRIFMAEKRFEYKYTTEDELEEMKHREFAGLMFTYDKDDRISLLETQMAAQQAGYEAQRRLNQQMMEMMQRMYPNEVFPNVQDP